MHRFKVEWRVKAADEARVANSEDAIIVGGSTWVFADTVTDAAWQVTFMLGSHLEVVSAKRD